MRFHADLHIHSKYSRACSRDCDLEHLAWWARRKGITLVGTGDFTHPAWFAHLRENLVPAEPGVFRLREEVDRDVRRSLPPSLAAAPLRFMLSVEISTIYKRDERTRKVHHLVYVPDFAAAEAFNSRLGRIGNIASDGRPILGLDSRDLLEIVLESGEGAYLVPAHVWTPWFAVFGSKSGFDRIEDCYRDLAHHIFALETGLSSDPAMNWRVSALDGYRMVSNSDAHSPPMLGRETTVFDTDVDYFAVRRALQTGVGHAGSVEFFPEEGKYHVDGHRKCGVRKEPHETRALDGVCPTCGKPLTVGVLSRVEDLADRPEGFVLDGAASFLSLVPLPEIMGEILGVGPKSKKVLGEVANLTSAWGPELAILQDVPVDHMEPRSPLLAEAIGRLRRGEVIREAGYDGEYGVIRLFEPGELARTRAIAVPTLFGDALPGALPEDPSSGTGRASAAPGGGAGPRSSAATGAARPAGASASSRPPAGRSGQADRADRADRADQADHVDQAGHVDRAGPAGSLLDGLDPEQRAAAAVTDGPLLIVAGPGTGKTRTLTHRIAHLVTAHGVPPEHCLAITFTRRAAEEMAGRLAVLVPEHAAGVTTATFHSLGLGILRESHERVGLSPDFGIADQDQQQALAVEIAGGEREARRLLAALAARHRAGGATAAAGRPTNPPDVPGPANPPDGPDPQDPSNPPDPPDRYDPAQAAAVEQYTKELRQRNLIDFDDLIALPVALLTADPELAAGYRERYRWISVDEYQDIDEQQYRLLRLLAPPDGNLTAIGDPDQAIYRFRGADVRFFLRFQQDFPSARSVQLTRNYRSGAGILTAALQVIAPSTLVPDRRLRPMGDHGTAKVGIRQAATDRAEGSFVARTIEQLLGGASFHALDSGRVDSDGVQNLGFSDFAVLYRTDRQAQAVMDALTTAGLPFQKRSHDRLADQPGVAQVLDELAHAARAAAVPPGADRAGRGVAARLKQAVEPCVARLTPAGAEQGEAAAPGTAADVARLYHAVDLLMPLADRCGDDVERFRAELALGVAVDTWDPRAERISLLTLHAAKGLEFPVVFVVGCEDGLLPLRWPGAPAAGADASAAEEVNEERRLLFVGMTRAQRHLYVSHAARRLMHSTVRDMARSPFLADIDPSVCETIHSGRPARAERSVQLRLM